MGQDNSRIPGCPLELPGRAAIGIHERQPGDALRWPLEWPNGQRVWLDRLSPSDLLVRRHDPEFLHLPV